MLYKWTVLNYLECGFWNRKYIIYNHICDTTTTRVWSGFGEIDSSPRGARPEALFLAVADCQAITRGLKICAKIINERRKTVKRRKIMSGGAVYVYILLFRTAHIEFMYRKKKKEKRNNWGFSNTDGGLLHPCGGSFRHISYYIHAFYVTALAFRGHSSARSVNATSIGDLKPWCTSRRVTVRIVLWRVRISNLSIFTGSSRKKYHMHGWVAITVDKTLGQVIVNIAYVQTMVLNVPTVNVFSVHSTRAVVRNKLFSFIRFKKKE